MAADGVSGTGPEGDRGGDQEVGVNSVALRPRRWIRRHIKTALLTVAVLIFICIACFVVLVFRGMHHLFAPFDKAAAAMQRPENYVPAELYLARLWQSDPALMHSDPDGMPPDWTPPEIGRLQPHYINAGGGLSVDGGGGLIDFFGLTLNRDDTAVGAAMSAYTLTYQDNNGEKVLDHFTILASERLTEEEFVRLGLAELSRREAALKAGSVIVFNADPAAERRRLLAQHPKVAQELGYKVSTTAPGPLTP